MPRESIEAAQIDGADWWAQFRFIELFYLRPLFLLIIFFRLADVLRVFDHVFILTGGTGITKRDSTFEAVEAMLDKRLTGFGQTGGGCAALFEWQRHNVELADNVVHPRVEG